MNITSAWSAFSIEPFPEIDDHEEVDRVQLRLLDTFATDCISAYVDDGSLNANDVRLLKRCIGDIDQVLPALSGEALLYFERLSGLAMLVVDQIDE